MWLTEYLNMGAGNGTSALTTLYLALLFLVSLSGLLNSPKDVRWGSLYDQKGKFGLKKMYAGGRYIVKRVSLV